MTILNLKVISDLDCNVYVDNELVATVKKDSLTIIPLSEGEFWVEFIPFFNSDCKVQTIVSLENHKVIQVSVSSNFASADFRKITTYNFQKS